VNWPLTRAERAAERERIREAALAAARRDALRFARSIRCGERGHHADLPGGCANDGTGCLCECHDPREETGE
jgi:hypothetical protein